MTATDPRPAALAAALHETMVGCALGADRRGGHIAMEDHKCDAAAILATLPDGWCGHELLSAELLSAELLSAESIIAHNEEVMAEMAQLRAALAGLAKAAALPRNTRADRGGGVTLKGEWIAVPKADFDALRAALAQAKEATK
jgi:hypothetical protein